jgi:protein arginine N-methyltransferase 1
MMNNDLEFHAFCLTDTGTRLDQFRAAIAARVKPGATVVDLGAGSGILSFLACRAGARRVYAIEAGGSIEYGRLLAARNGFQDRIEFIGRPATQVVLPERVDVIVGDIHDTFGLQASGVSTVIDARQRFLEADGVLIPSAIQLMAVPVDAPDLYRRTVDVWQQQIQDVDVSPLRAWAANRPAAARFERHNLLGDPAPLARIDLARAESPYVGGSTRVRVKKRGILHGVCGCFVSTLADGIVMGNVPGESGTTNFAQAFFPLESPVDVMLDDVISIRIETRDCLAARWQVDVSRAGVSLICFDHSTLHSEALSIDTLRRQSPDYRPRLTNLGAIERDLLDRFDGTHSAADLESWLADRSASVLPSGLETTSFLKQTIERCG